MVQDTTVDIEKANLSPGNISLRDQILGTKCLIGLGGGGPLGMQLFFHRRTEPRTASQVRPRKRANEPTRWKNAHPAPVMPGAPSAGPPNAFPPVPPPRARLEFLGFGVTVPDFNVFHLPKYQVAAIQGYTQKHSLGVRYTASLSSERASHPSPTQALPPLSTARQHNGP